MSALDDAVDASTARLLGYDGRIFPTFDSLQLGFDAGQAKDYLLPAVESAIEARSSGRLVGACLAFATVAVEAERRRLADGG